MKVPCMKAPCSNCPFRKDAMKGWLGEKRMTQILRNDSFVCHKTTNGKKKERLQCAGHMLLKGYENLFYRIAKVINIDLGLKGRDLVFHTKKDCIKHHSKNNLK